MTSDRELLDCWWSRFLETGSVPSELEPVQGRLIRSVHRAELPSGGVFVKTMTFPRSKDRLRYLLRPLPAVHEAAALRRARAAGLPCPEVVDVRVARRLGLPFRSWLVLRALPTVVERTARGDRLADEAALSLRMLEAGIEHRDLHRENFVRLDSGELAVLDMQSVRLHGRRVDSRRCRLAAAARLIRDAEDSAAAIASLRRSGLIRSDGEGACVSALALRMQRAFKRQRVLRCLRESTGFERIVRWNGVEYRRRGVHSPGRWIRGGDELRRAWIGQRVAQLFGSRSPCFDAYFRKWWWLGGRAALYVPQACSEDRIEAERKASVAAYEAFLESLRTG